MKNTIKRMLMTAFFLLAAVCMCMTVQPAQAATCKHTDQLDLTSDEYKAYYGAFGVPVPGKAGYHYNATLICNDCSEVLAYDKNDIVACLDVDFFVGDPAYTSNGDQATHKLSVQCGCGQTKSVDQDCTWEYVETKDVGEYRTHLGGGQYFVHYKVKVYKCSLCGQTKEVQDGDICFGAVVVADTLNPDYSVIKVDSTHHCKLTWYCTKCNVWEYDASTKTSCKTAIKSDSDWIYGATCESCGDGKHHNAKATCACGNVITIKTNCDFRDYATNETGCEKVSSTKHQVNNTVYQRCFFCQQETSYSKPVTEAHNFQQVGVRSFGWGTTYHYYYKTYKCFDCGYSKKVIVGDKEKHDIVVDMYATGTYRSCNNGTHEIVVVGTCNNPFCEATGEVVTGTGSCTKTNKKTTTAKYNKTYHKVTTTWDINCKKCGYKKTGFSSTKKVKHTFSKKTVTKHNSTYHWTVTTYTCKECGYSYSVTGTKVKHTMKTSGTTYKKVANSSPEKHTKTVTKACTCGYKKSTSTKEKCNSSSSLTSHYYSSESKCKKVTCWICSKCSQGVSKNNEVQKVTYESHSRKWVGSTATDGSLSYKCSKCSHVFATESSFYKDVTIKSSENTKTIKFPISKYDSVSSIKVTYSKYLSITKKTSNSFTVKALARGSWKLKNGDWVSSDTWVTVKLKSGIFYTYCFEIEP